MQLVAFLLQLSCICFATSCIFFATSCIFLATFRFLDKHHGLPEGKSRFRNKKSESLFSLMCKTLIKSAKSSYGTPFERQLQFVKVAFFLQLFKKATFQKSNFSKKQLFKHATKLHLFCGVIKRSVRDIKGRTKESPTSDEKQLFKQATFQTGNFSKKQLFKKATFQKSHFSNVQLSHGNGESRLPHAESN